MMVRGRARGDRAHFAVMEAMLVGFVVLSAVGFVAFQAGTGDAPSGSMDRLGSRGEDALAVLGETPAGDPDAYNNRLEELLTVAFQEGCAPLDGKLEQLLPEGVRYDVFLENGFGGRIPVCVDAEPRLGETVTVSTLVSPRWSNIFLFANVTPVSGTVTMDLVDGGTTYQSSVPVSLQGLVIDGSYANTEDNVTLTFENGYQSAFDSHQGVRYTGFVDPEHVNLYDAYVPGYDVPYETSRDHAAYELSTQDHLQPVSSYRTELDVNQPPLGEDVYAVHPKYTMSSSLSTAFTEIAPDDRFQADAREVGLGDAVTFTYDYEWDRFDVDTLEQTDGRLVVYNPLGIPVASYDATSLNGTFRYEVPHASLWGTHVAHLQFEWEELDSGDGTGRFYYINKLATFDVNPPGWADKPVHVTPAYRLSLSMGYEDWARPDRGLPDAGPGDVMDRSGWNDRHLPRPENQVTTS